MAIYVPPGVARSVPGLRVWGAVQEKTGRSFLFFLADLIHQKFQELFPKAGRHFEDIGRGSHALAKLPYSGLTSKRTRAIVNYCGWFGPREVIFK
jgi:hypothetical protein